jgi:hypothetical protein
LIRGAMGFSSPSMGRVVSGLRRRRVIAGDRGVRRVPAD